MHRRKQMTAAVALAPAPAVAQDAAGDRVNTVIVYGDDECPQSTSDEIVVCARMEESERFRIPEPLRQSSDPENEPWASKVRAYETVGQFGALSCSPVGSGGELGCTAKMIEAAYQERATGSDVRAGELIAAASAAVQGPRTSGSCPASVSVDALNACNSSGCAKK